MLSRELNQADKSQYNQLVHHPLQSWEWGDFRESLSTKVIRIGNFDKNILTSAYQLTLHSIPYLPFTVGYFPKGPLPDPDMIKTLAQFGQQNNCIFIKLEPNVTETSDFKLQISDKLIPSARPLFTKYTFQIDLTLSEEQLLKNMSSKTRYNVRLAQKRDVTIQEENTEAAFEKYLELTQETTARQGFYAHNETYHRRMWQILNQQPLKNKLPPMAHLFTARYQGQILVTWILFLFNGVLYYPYGASSSEHREVMASNLMLWETMRWGKQQGAKIFDLWGTPGPDPKPTDPYYGFHRFKLGYGPKLVEFIGSYDLIVKPLEYKLFITADKLRWVLLKLKAKLLSA